LVSDCVSTDDIDLTTMVQITMFICILYNNLNTANLRYNTPKKYLMFSI